MDPPHLAGYQGGPRSAPDKPRIMLLTVSHQRRKCGISSELPPPVICVHRGQASTGLHRTGGPAVQPRAAPNSYPKAVRCHQPRDQLPTADQMFESGHPRIKVKYKLVWRRRDHPNGGCIDRDQVTSRQRTPNIQATRPRPPRSPAKVLP